MSITGPVRFGVLGCADIAWRRMLPAMAAEPDVRLVAVASRDEAKARKFAARFGCDAVTGYRNLLLRSDVDAVYVPLPAMLHAEWVEQALLAGKHVLAEKPLTSSHRQASRLVELAASRGLLLFENFMFLHHSQHATVRRLLADGAIGELRAFAAAFTIPPKPAGDIRYQADVGGGALLDVGVYPIRAALHFLGPELGFAGGVLRWDARRNVVSSGSILLTTPQGVAAQLTFGMEHSYRSTYELSGSTGRILLDRVFTPPESYQPVVHIERQDHREERVLPADHQFANVVRHFTQALRHGSDLALDAENTLRQARLVDEVLAWSRMIRVGEDALTE
ncbi:Gfo/Idh/MocA family protein [Microbispora sp. H10830]|uniref:Gfo/Idh/MocA family protein n=1 Tax=Microbispora sp. H10830 TaxID=2729109 RepID=UPI0005A61884|nr:Gfo/Idh/MocA family oxidoreductase [Microbispora sp. H10830]